MNGYNPESGQYDAQDYPYTYRTTPQRFGQNSETPSAAVTDMAKKAKWLTYAAIAGAMLLVLPSIKRSLRQIGR